MELVNGGREGESEGRKNGRLRVGLGRIEQRMIERI